VYIAGILTRQMRGARAAPPNPAHSGTQQVAGLTANQEECVVSDNEFTGWRKSSHSGTGNSCVEVATSVGPGEAGGNGAAGGARRVGVRDTTQNGRGPVLEFSAGAWTEFLAGLKHGGRSLGIRNGNP
jgi:hypothetical protein